MARAKRRNVTPKQAMMRPKMVPPSETGVRQGGGGKAGPRPTGVGPQPARVKPPGPQPAKRKPAAHDPLGVRHEAHMSFMRANPNVARGSAEMKAAAARFNSVYKPYAQTNPNATRAQAESALSGMLGYTITRIRPNRPAGHNPPARISGGPFKMPRA